MFIVGANYISSKAGVELVNINVGN